MDIELIKEKLQIEVERMIKEDSPTFEGTSGGFDTIQMWSTKLKGVLANDEGTGLADKISDKLNILLEEENIEFTSEKEKEEFIQDMQPTINELIVRHIRN